MLFFCVGAVFVREEYFGQGKEVIGRLLIAKGANLEFQIGSGKWGVVGLGFLDNG